jgi:hypothetical protein
MFVVWHHHPEIDAKAAFKYFGRIEDAFAHAKKLTDDGDVAAGERAEVFEVTVGEDVPEVKKGPIAIETVKAGKGRLVWDSVSKFSGRDPRRPGRVFIHQNIEDLV